MNPRPCAILLAAGRGERYRAQAGTACDKLLQPLADGTPLVLGAARALRANLVDVVAVLRPDSSAELAPLLSEAGLRLVFAPEAAYGMGHSLAAGVAACAQATGWIVAPADMPWLPPAAVAAVVDALSRGAPLAAPQYAGQRGHPVGFAAHYRDELLALQGDAGGRAILQRDRALLQALPWSDPSILLDVDLPADLA